MPLVRSLASPFTLLAFSRLIQAGEALANPHNDTNLQIMPLIKDHFCPKIRAILQKNWGPMKIILHFF
jgi:hypothetical protein